jgi:hypothetical protein
LPIAAQKPVLVRISNSLSISRVEEIAEVPVAKLPKRLRADIARVQVIDDEGRTLPHQLTHDGKLLFPVSVGPMSTKVYTLTLGASEMSFDTIACGRLYPERYDDLAWENDRVAFRAYGPKLQARGEKAYGYDVFTKRDARLPVLPDRYEKELHQHISYHVDHGNGMDCYAVGPTLGGGAAALMAGDSIVYPWCFSRYEILDNGPLRFTVRLEYQPFEFLGDTLRETRILSLDADSYLNRATISFSGLRRPSKIAAGIVLHTPATETARITALPEYIAYTEPTDHPNGENGEMYMGVVPAVVAQEACIQPFAENETLQLKAGAFGHVLSIGEITRARAYIYYFGSAWSRAGMSIEKWRAYLSDFACRISHPLKISL